MRSGGNLSLTTAVSGATYTAFSAAPCKQLVIANASGQDVEFRQDAAGAALTIINGTAFQIYGINDASQIGVRRVDQSNTPVTVKARWET